MMRLAFGCNWYNLLSVGKQFLTAVAFSMSLSEATRIEIFQHLSRYRGWIPIGISKFLSKLVFLLRYPIGNSILALNVAFLSRIETEMLWKLALFSVGIKRGNPIFPPTIVFDRIKKIYF